MGITYIFITLSHTSFILDYKERVTDEMFVGRGFGASGASWEVFLPFFFFGVCKYVCATWESRCWSKLNTEVFFFFFFLIFFPPAYILRKKLKNSSLTPVYGSYLWVLNFKVTSRLHLNMNSCRKMNLAQVFTVNQFEVAVSCVFYARTHTHTHPCSFEGRQTYCTNTTNRLETEDSDTERLLLIEMHTLSPWY